jgi:hypothetical protein
MNNQDFRLALTESIPACRQLGIRYPEDPMISSILAQLNFLNEWQESGIDWKERRLKELNFGLLASKSIDEDDLQLAQVLYRMANYIIENRN